MAMQMKKLALAFGLALTAAGCASAGRYADIDTVPAMNNADRCIEDRANLEAAPVFASDPTVNIVRLEPLLFKEIRKACTFETQESPLYYENRETIYVLRHASKYGFNR